MTDTNYTIPKKVFIFENDVTDGFIVLEIFPYDIIVRSQTNDPAEAKLRLAHFLRDEVGTNAALEMHFDENLFGGSYVAKIALIGKPSKKPSSLNEREVTNSVSRIMENIQKISKDQITKKWFLSCCIAITAVWSISLILKLVAWIVSLIDIEVPPLFIPNFWLLCLVEVCLAIAVVFFIMNKLHVGKFLDFDYVYFSHEKIFIRRKQ